MDKKPKNDVVSKTSKNERRETDADWEKVPIDVLKFCYDEGQKRLEAPLSEEFQLKPNSIKLYAAVLKDKLKQSNNNGTVELEKLFKEIAQQTQRLKNAKELMLDGEISATEYKEMKYEIEEANTKFMLEVNKLKEGIENHDSRIDDCVELLLNLEKYYLEGIQALSNAL